MKLIVIMSLFTASFVHAGTIVPDIQWNKVNLNASGAAIGLSKRNNATLSYTSGSESGDDEDKYTGISALANYSTDDYSIEGFINETSNEPKDGFTTYTDNLVIGYGQKSDSGLSFGVDFTHSKFSTSEFNSVGFSAVKEMNGLLFGGELTTIVDNLTDARRNTFTLGLGSLKSDQAWEVVYSHTPAVGYETGGFDVETSRIDSFTGSYTKQTDRLQYVLSFSKSIQVTEYEDGAVDDDSERTTSALVGQIEYKSNESLFFGGTISKAQDEYVDNDDEDNNEEENDLGYGFLVRYKTNNYQVIASYNLLTEETEFEDGSDDEKVDSTTVALSGTYFF